MARPTALLKRLLIFVHRWLGVALAVLFLLWFVSGIVMMYWSFPGVSARDRLERLPALDPSSIRLSAQEAFAAAGRERPPAQVRLTSFDGRPVYRAGGGGRGGGPAMVFADDGTVPSEVDDALIDRVASAWTGRPLSEATRTSVEEVDQWTVAGNLRAIRPLYKYSFPDGQQVYVNGNNAEVVQYTTTASRFWAYLGAIPHWLYFTPIRKHQEEWFSFVVWSSLIGTISAVIGLVIALWMYSPRKRYRYAGAPTSIPYRGWKRWHAIAGLLFGVVTITWTFSGLLTMGPFPIMDRLTELTVPPPTPPPEAAAEASQDGRGRFGRRGGGPNLAGALRGRGAGMGAYAEKHPSAAIASVAGFDVKELEYTSFAGEPVYLATNGRDETRIIPVRGEPTAAFEIDEIMRIVREAAGDRLAELRVMEQYDAYYLDRRRESPLPVVYVRMNDAVGTRYYIDPKTATVVGSYSARAWVNRWLQSGLHSLNFPWLYNHRPLWDIVVITLMLGGTALCMTSIVLAWRVITRRVASLIGRNAREPDELVVDQR